MNKESLTERLEIRLSKKMYKKLKKLTNNVSWYIRKLIEKEMG